MPGALYGYDNTKARHLSMAKRKTSTSTEVKRRWNEANYSRLTIYLPKAQAEEYKARCDRLGISLSDVPKEAINQFLRQD